MCEQTEVQYLPDEVVWVKLHQPSVWWPGQVQDYNKLPEDVTEGLRKKPIAIVKFFQEDTFEYVNNLNNIYHYNCSKKYDFIKKGLALARSKRPERPSHMDLFPQDVATAETLTHGDPDIIRDEAFAPEEKPNYEGLFGSEKKKNVKKTKGSVVDSILRERPSWRVKPLIAKHTPSSPKSGNSPKLSKVITHPRFINKALRGETDHKVYIREQPAVEDETASPSSEYRCHTCGFVTARLNVIVLHYRSHSKSVTPVAIRTKPAKPKTTKSTVTKHVTKVETPTKANITDPLKKRNILKEESASVLVPKPKPKPADKTDKTSPNKTSPNKSKSDSKAHIENPKSQAPKRKAKTEIRSESEGKKAKQEDIQDLLKDWSDEEMEEESRIVGRTSDDDDQMSRDGEEPSDKADDNGDDANAKPTTTKIEEDGKDNVDDEKQVETTTEDKSKDEQKKTKSSASPAKSKAVFDFDDSDDGLDPKLTHSTRVFGRKIPRVIDNIKERRSSFPEMTSSDSEERKEVEEKEKTDEKEDADESCEAVVEADETIPAKEESAEREKELESMNAEIDSLLETTAVPDLPEIPRMNTFSMDVPEDEPQATEKNKQVLREHNNISPNAARMKESVEDVIDRAAPSDEPQSDEPPKNSLPEVDSAVEDTSTPPQADSAKITAEIETPASKPETVNVKSAVITSVILSSPQSTSGGDHSYVCEVPPLVPTSPKPTSPSKIGKVKSPTYVLSRSSPTKSPTSSSSGGTGGVMRVVGVAPTSAKSLPSLVKNDGKYVIVQSCRPSSTEPANQKVMPSLTRASASATASSTASATTRKVITQPQTGKKLVILTKKPSGNVVLTPQKQPNILSSSSKNSLSKASPSACTTTASAISSTTLSSQKAAETKTLVQSVVAPKKSIVLTSAPGGIRDSKTILVPVSSVNAKSPGVLASRAPAAAGKKSIVLPQTVKLVSSKDSPGKVVLQMESQKTKVTLPTMKRTIPQVRVAPSPSSSPSPSLKLTSPKIFTSGTSAKALAAVTAPKSLSPAVGKTPPKQTTNKFFHRDSTSSPLSSVKTIVKKQIVPVKKTGVVPTKATEMVNPSPSSRQLPQMQTKPSILQSSSRGLGKRTPSTKSSTAPVPKESAAVKESKPQVVLTAAQSPAQAPAPAAAAAPQESVVVLAEGSASEPLEPSSIVEGAPIDGSADGAAIMYILDNGTLISYDQVNQADNQARTVLIDPASLTSSAAELGNLIFTFDESAGSQGTLLSIAQAQQEARPVGSSQDILAEALANTQVLQAEASASELILDSVSLSTNTIPCSSALYPNNVLTLSNDVLETSLTLNQPIMTPLEVPSAVSSLQHPPVGSASLELPIPIGPTQPDITISTSSYASLPIPSATIQRTVYSDATSATYSTIVPVPVLSGDPEANADADADTLLECSGEEAGTNTGGA